MYKILFIFLFSISLHSLDHNKSDQNKSISLEQKHIQDQIKREEKYAKEQKFYQGDEYDLKAVEVDPKSLDTIEAIEPDYDFDITDVYRDDI